MRARRRIAVAGALVAAALVLSPAAAIGQSRGVPGGYVFPTDEEGGTPPGGRSPGAVPSVPAAPQAAPPAGPGAAAAPTPSTFDGDKFGKALDDVVAALRRQRVARLLDLCGQVFPNDYHRQICRQEMAKRYGSAEDVERVGWFSAASRSAYVCDAQAMAREFAAYGVPGNVAGPTDDFVAAMGRLTQELAAEAAACAPASAGGAPAAPARGPAPAPASPRGGAPGTADSDAINRMLRGR